MVSWYKTKRQTECVTEMHIYLQLGHLWDSSEIPWLPGLVGLYARGVLLWSEAFQKLCHFGLSFRCGDSKAGLLEVWLKEKVQGWTHGPSRDTLGGVCMFSPVLGFLQVTMVCPQQYPKNMLQSPVCNMTNCWLSSEEGSRAPPKRLPTAPLDGWYKCREWTSPWG